MGITNQGTIENGTYTAGGALTYEGSADSTVTETTMTGASVDITNAGTLTNGSYTAKTGAMTVTNRGKLSAGAYTAKAGTMGITNEGTIENGTYTARGDLTYTDTAGASLKDGTLISEEGKAKITAHGVLQIKKLSAKDSATVEADHDVTLPEAEAGTLAIKSGGSVNAGTLTAKAGDASVKAKKDVTIGTMKAGAGNATIEATEGKLDVTTLNAKEHAALTSGGAMEVTDANVGSVTANAGTTLHVAKLISNGEATLTSKDEAKLDEVTAGTLTAESTAGSVNADMLTATTSDAKVKAKTDATIGTLKAEAGSTTVEATEGKLDVTTLNAKEHAALTSGGSMEVTEATVGSVMANAGSTIHVKKLTSTGEATLTSKDEAKLDDVTAGTLAAESKAGSVDAGTLTATTGDAEVKAKMDVTIGTLTAEAGNATIEATEGKLGVTTLNAKSLTANAGTTLDATKIHTAGDAGLASGSDMVLHAAEAGGKLTANAGGSISAKGTDATISGSTIEMTAKEDIRITDRSLVGKLDGVDTSTPAGSTTGSGAAGSLVTGEAKPHDFDVSGKGSARLSSAGGKVALSAKKVEIDTLANGEGDAADLKISADNIGIDDLAGEGAQHVTIHGKDGQSQAHYAGIHSTSAGGTLVKDSKVEHLHLTGKEPLGITNTAIGGDSVLATDKIRVTIQKNPGSSQAEHFGNLSLNGYDISTDHVMTSVKDGLTVNGERFPMTAEGVMNASLYEDRTLGRDGREKEEETEKDSPSLAFGAPNDKEAYEVVK